LSSAYWWVVIIGALFTLARFSEAFLLLRAQQGGLAVAWATFSPLNKGRVVGAEVRIRL
jgi:hypothetical protein